MILAPHVLEHTDEDDFVEGPHGPGQIAAVIAEDDIYRQVRTEPSCEFVLRSRNRNPRHMTSIILSRMFGKRSPAATDVEDPITLFDAELSSDEIVFVVLGFIEAIGISPIGARIRHCRTEHLLEELVAHVIVGPSDLNRPVFGLEI